MPFDMLVLDSGEWLLAEELPAEPWYILIYRQRGKPRNELHIWLPRCQDRGSGRYAFRRYWMDGGTRWCVEIPTNVDLAAVRRGDEEKLRIRFTAPDGLVFWSTLSGQQRLADLTDAELQQLRLAGTAGTFSKI